MDPTTAVAAAAAEFEESGMSQQEIADSIAKQNASNNGINLPAGYESSTGILFGSPEYDAECEYSSDEELVPETETARQWVRTGCFHKEFGPC